MYYAHAQNKGKWSRTDDHDTEPQWALRSHWNNRENGKNKLGFPHAKAPIRKLSAVRAFTFLKIAIPVLAEFKEYLL